MHHPLHPHSQFIQEIFSLSPLLCGRGHCSRAETQTEGPSLQSSGPCAVVASPGPASHCWRGPQKQSFHSLSFQGDADETLQGQNFCLCQLAYGKTVVTFYVISLEVAEPISDIKWGQWSFCSLASSGQCSHLSVLQLESYCPLDLSWAPYSFWYCSFCVLCVS